MNLRFFAACGLVLGAMWSCRAQIAPALAPTIEPKSDTIWTSTREIRHLLPILGGGGVWAATSGGVLRFNRNKWTKWTRRDGLPSHEALEFRELRHQPIARFPTATAAMQGEKWKAHSAPVWEKRPLQFGWKKQTVRVALDHLQFGEKKFPMPPQSGGTHISAVMDVGPTLVVGLYGDGLWNFDGEKWTAAAPVPPSAREITALANDGQNLWLGTRRDGIFRRQNQKWQQILQPNEPFAHNIQNFAEFRGVVWASTLDDGLIYRTGNQWQTTSTPTLSSSAPRQMLVWQNQLFVRHGGGLVDSFDGRSWTKNAFQNLPRKGVYALAGNSKTLFAAGWGGWSEWNGRAWTPHFDLPQLQGVPLMGLLAQGEYLWIATQSRGLGRHHRATKKFRWFDERDGLSDDWITALSTFGGKIYAGTFVGGLARLDGSKWKVFEELKGQNVTALAESGGKLFVAARTGIWEIRGDAAVKVEKAWLDSEVQALFSGKSGLWVGTRTSLNWLRTNNAT